MSDNNLSRVNVCSLTIHNVHVKVSETKSEMENIFKISIEMVALIGWLETLIPMNQLFVMFS